MNARAVSRYTVHRAARLSTSRRPKYVSVQERRASADNDEADNNNERSLKAGGRKKIEEGGRGGSVEERIIEAVGRSESPRCGEWVSSLSLDWLDTGHWTVSLRPVCSPEPVSQRPCPTPGKFPRIG